MLLMRLLDVLFPLRDTERRVRELSGDEILQHLAPVTVDIPLAPIALLPYRDPVVKSLIIEAKFRDNAAAAELLGTILREFLLEEYTDAVLVPVPLSKQRHRERGYNQAERICRFAVASVPITVDRNLLVRTRDTKAQTSLGGVARRRNMRDAFRVRTIEPERIYIVVDDVVTTGATLAAACEALRSAGATTVIPLALAH